VPFNEEGQQRSAIVTGAARHRTRDRAAAGGGRVGGIGGRSALDRPGARRSGRSAEQRRMPGSGAVAGRLRRRAGRGCGGGARRTLRGRGRGAGTWWWPTPESQWPHPCYGTTGEQWQRTLDVNVTGVAHCHSAAADRW